VSHATILVAEDFAPFRDFARNELQRRTGFRVVSESDGSAAVETALELQPDVVVLDIGLPSVNGLDAACQIRSSLPQSDVVFLTQESSADIVHEAFSVGARGFIDKRRARYLLPTVEAILAGDGTPHHHRAHFSSHTTTMLDDAERFLAAALSAHHAAITIVTPAHQQQLRQRLKHLGGTVDAAIESGSFVMIDADELVAGLLADGLEHWRPLLKRSIEAAVHATGRPDGRVAVFGESAAMLWNAGNVDTAIALEQFGDEITRTMPVDMVCSYALLPLTGQAGFKTACAQHNRFVIR
jgi:DNA-binding NarL/FixJ family response regulator